MRALEPSTLTRLSVSELKGVPLAGSPSSAAAVSARTGAREELSGLDGSFDLPAKAAVDLLTVSWELSGVAVSCQVQVVPSRYCSLDDVRTHRADELQNEGRSDDDVFDARARAEDVIERECGRALQPVMEECFIDRPGCTARTQPIGAAGRVIHDISEVIRATAQDGSEVEVRPVRRGGSFVDVGELGRGCAATACIVHGMERTPPEVRHAVAALAARFLTARAEPDNAISMTGDGATISYVVEGASGITALPEVNALIKRHRVTDYFVG